MKARRILVTGASGFVGAAVTHRLVADGRRVTVLLRPGCDTWRLAGILGKVSVLRGDLRSATDALSQLGAVAPDAIVHLAWEGVKGKDRDSPAQLSNIDGSISLYLAARRLGVGRFLGLGSQAEYGQLSGKVSESAPARPTSLFGAAKLSTHLLLERMAAIDGISFAWLRLFSAYGPKDDPSWLIPHVTLKLLAGERPALTKAEQLWDFAFVDDVAAAVVAVLDSDATGVFNVGSGDALPLRDIIVRIRDLIDQSVPLGFGELPYRTDQVMHLQADIGSLAAKTGWRPQTSLDSGLTATVDWYKSWRRAP